MPLSMCTFKWEYIYLRIDIQMGVFKHFKVWQNPILLQETIPFFSY